MRRCCLLLLAVLLALAVRPTTSTLGQPPPPTPAATGPEPLRTAEDRPFDIRHLRLDLRVDIPARTLEGTATLHLVPLRDIRSVRLDAVEFEVKKVSLRVGKDAPANLSFSHDGKNLVAELPATMAVWPEGDLVVDYRVRNPRAGLFFFGPTKIEPDTPLMAWSQGEPITNRYWFPCVDQPNQRQATELVVTTANGFEVLSNGALVEKTVNEEAKTTTYHWKQDGPHPSYLVTLVVGQFDVVREEWAGKDGKALPVYYYVPRGRKEDIARTFGRTREMLDFFSSRFGIQYPWEKYAQVVVEQFTSGGMENTSATTLGDRALHDQRALLDSSPDALIAHELAHQWWGDLVTCRDWAHLWLNEGFASYCEALWDEHSKGTDDYAYTMLLKGRQALAGGKERPIVDRHYPYPRSMFDARSYPKGAFVLHMLRQRLGEKAFWAGIQAYGSEHRGQSVETVDLRRTLERVSGRDLERFFHDWTERPGHPVLDIKTEYDNASKRLRITVKQTQTAEAFAFPLPIRVVADGKVIVQEEDITGKEQQLTLVLDAPPTLVEIDPGQVVLAEVTETKGRDLWLAQLRQGSTVAARVRAADNLGKGKTLPEVEALAAALGEERVWGVQVEIAHALGSTASGTAGVALLAGLKHAHPKVRRACVEQVSKFGRDAAVAPALKDLLNRGDPSYFVEAAALTAYAKLKQPDAVSVLLPWLTRSSYSDVLRTATLAGLGQTRDPAALDTLVSWSGRGKPRACRQAALAALGHFGGSPTLTPPQRDKILTTVSGCLEGENWPVRQAAVNALRELGQVARPATATLEALVQNDPDERVQDAAKRALTAVRGNMASAGTEVEKLREELEKVRRSQDALRERLDKMERLEKKGF
jgi:aminopeptidase N